MSLWQTVTWDVARAGGFTAYILLTLSVAWGLALTMHWQSGRWPRLINSELHNFLTLLALIFTGIHVLAVWIDPFTRFNWSEVFIPFVSHYRPLWMAFGIVGLYLGLAIGLSTWLRRWIGYKWWRRLHILTLLLYFLVTIHGIATGSDTRTWWGVGIYLVSILVVGTLLWGRLIEPANKQSRAHPIWAVVVVLVILAGAALTVLGPLQPGWNTVANNGNGSGGSPAALAAQSLSSSQSSNTNPFAPPFTDSVQGTLNQNGPDDNGDVTLQLNLTVSNGTQTSGTLLIILHGQSFGDDDNNIDITSSQISLASPSGQTLYTGSYTTLTDDRELQMTALLTSPGNSAQKLKLQIDLRIREDQSVSGSISGSAA
jgi:hypothetical protein